MSLIIQYPTQSSSHDGLWVSFNERFPARSLPGRLPRNITRSLRAHSFKLRAREKAAMLKTEYFQRERDRFQGKVTGAASDFRPRRGSVRVGLVKPTGPCLPLSLHQFRPAEMRWSTWQGKCVCVCVCVCVCRVRRKKSDFGFGPRQENAEVSSPVTSQTTG